MREPIPIVEASGARARKLMARLEALRDRHRLGMHVCIEYPGVGYPIASNHILHAIRAPDIQSQLQQGTAPLISLTLAPSRWSMPIRPFSVRPNAVMPVGYLLNLDDKQRHPPRVISSSEKDILSTDDPYDKGLASNTELPELRALFDRYPTMQDFTRAVGSDLTLSSRQLDILGQAMENPETIARRLLPEGCLDHNELVVAAAQEHIEAIMITAMPAEPVPVWYMPALHLSAALAGLDHQARGYDYPVVMYHATGDRAGSYQYLAQGREECIALAHAALRELKRDPMAFGAFRELHSYHSFERVHYDALHAHVLKELSLDLSLPSTVFLTLLDAAAQKAGQSR